MAHEGAAAVVALIVVQGAQHIAIGHRADEGREAQVLLAGAHGGGAGVAVEEGDEVIEGGRSAGAAAITVAHEEVRGEEEAEPLGARLQPEEAFARMDGHEEVLQRVLLVGGGDAQPMVLGRAGIGPAINEVAAAALLAVAPFLLVDHCAQFVLHGWEVGPGFGDGLRDGHGGHVHAPKETTARSPSVCAAPVLSTTTR